MTIYLYVKQHSVTGLKYFGKTTRKDPYKYNGSGKYWKHHISKYGKDQVITLEIWSFDDEEECSKFALDFSIKNNIVESAEWANLIPENGLDGRPKGLPLSEEHRKKMTGRVRSKEHCKNLSKNHARPFLGKKFSKEHRQKLSENNVGFKGRSHSIETKLKTSESLKKAYAERCHVRVCPHCGVSGRGANMTRYHFNNCKSAT